MNFDFDNPDEYQKLRELYVAAAKQTDVLGDLCRLCEYDPNVGEVPAFWDPLYFAFFKEALKAGAALALNRPQPIAIQPTQQDYDTIEMRLAELLGWKEQPMRKGELFHFWQSPSETALQSKPYWSRDNGDAFRLALDHEITTSYKDGVAVASFEAAGRLYEVREPIDPNGFDKKAAAMRIAITQAVLAKLELEMTPTHQPSSGPQL